MTVGIRCNKSAYSLCQNNIVRVEKYHIPNEDLHIADLVSEINFGCLIRLLKRFCLTYSAARAPP